MTLKTLSLLITCVCLVACGCESQRYKPADWKVAGNSTLTKRGDTDATKLSGKKVLKTPDSPTNWMELSGTGGEAITPRRGNGTLPSRSGVGTLPSRGSTLPMGTGYRGTSMPNRQGTTLSSRGYQSSGNQSGGNTSLPNRQNQSSGTSLPRR